MALCHCNRKETNNTTLYPWLPSLLLPQPLAAHLMPKKAYLPCPPRTPSLALALGCLPTTKLSCSIQPVLTELAGGWGGGKATPADGSPKAGAQMPVPAGRTWSIVAIHLLVGHRHDRMLELFPEVRDGLVDQEDGHGHEQQVDEDE